MSNPAPVALLGLGRMGTAIGHRLLDMGEHLVVWNRSPGAAASLVERGALLAASPADATSRCPIVLVIVRDAAALRDVYEGRAGITAASRPGVTVVEMSTVARPDILRAARAVEAAGARFVDAPVSGTVGPARTGGLVVMAGGTEADVERVRPLLAKLARKVLYAGPAGSGTVLKLVLNLPLATYWQTLGEALAIGQSHGLKLDAMLSALADSKAAIGALASKLPQITDAGAPVEFDLAGLHKDLLAMCQTAEHLGVRVPVAAAAAASAGEAVAAGWGGRDLAQLVRFVADGPGAEQPALPILHGAES